MTLRTCTSAIVLLFLSLTFAHAQLPGQDRCPRDITATVSATGHELCPDKRLDYFSVWCDMQDSTIILQGETSNATARDSVVARVKRITALPVNDDIELLPSKDLEKTIGVVKISTANLRRNPDVDAEMINQAIMGDRVTILKERPMFYFIQMADGYLGWIMKSSVQEMSEEEYANWNGLKKVMYNRNFGEVYSERKDDSDPVSDLVRGAVLAEIEEKGKWRQVQIADGRSGWVDKSDIVDFEKIMAHPTKNADDLVKTARQFIGHPYLWGGTSTKGFDCSGFTKTVYRLNGIQLPRDANMQVKIGRDVEIDPKYKNLKPGDLIFFGRRPDRITHVGMYIGNKKFIHSDGYVHINSFDPADADYSNYRVNGLQAVRRIL